MSEPAADIAHELSLLEAELKRLEAEYSMYFAGRLPRPPWETRSRVEAMVKRIDRARPSNYGVRYRFTTLQSRLASFIDLWDRALRAREEGRPGPFHQPRKEPERPRERPTDRIVQVATFSDPARERDKLRDLYDRVVEARREAGQDAVSFRRFTEIVSAQVAAMKKSGCAEVAFRVAVKEGKVAFTAKGLKGMKRGG